MEGGSLILNGLKTSSGAYGEEVLSIKPNSPQVQDGSYESEEQIIYKIDTSWQSEIDHFFECISLDAVVQFGNSRDALSLMEMIDRIYAVGKPNGAKKPHGKK